MRPRGRRDGRLVDDLPTMRKVVPHLMPTRVESTIYYRQPLDVERLMTWLEETNAQRPEAERVKFFHVFLAAFARLYVRRPELNRFVSGRKTYEHNDITFSFTVKRAMSDDAAEAQAHLAFTGAETIDEVRAKVEATVRHTRNDGHEESDQLMETLARLPVPVTAGIAKAVWALDALNVMPRFLQDAIPVYASAYVVNLGSLGAEAPFHHLYQRGTASVFAAIGTIRPEAVVDASGAIVARRRVDVVYTIDERATDGYYLVRSAQILQEMLDDPESLTRPPDSRPA